jgi:hypothetical protein
MSYQDSFTNLARSWQHHCVCRTKQQHISACVLCVHAVLASFAFKQALLVRPRVCTQAPLYSSEVERELHELVGAGVGAEAASASHESISAKTKHCIRLLCAVCCVLCAVCCIVYVHRIFRYAYGVGEPDCERGSERASTRKFTCTFV